MTKEDNKDFDNSTKFWICDNAYTVGDVKVRDHCDITGKYRGSAHRNVEWNHKIPVVFLYLSHKFDNNVLDLLKQKGFYPYE